MGEVYRARDTNLDRDVAVKILSDAFLLDPERLARFEREARILATLNHPHIAHIYGFERAGDRSVLVMELIEGEDLAQRLARGPIPLSEAVPIARQIAVALAAAHAKDIVHRDLKPANIKIDPDGHVKVLDFGLAHVAEEEHAYEIATAPTAPAQFTQHGQVLGTAAYMSPEQARGQITDRRTDIWAFGCVLYEMLAGRSAFGKATVSDTLAAVLEREPDWAALPGSTPRFIRSLLRRCLERDVRRRRRDIADIAVDLEEGNSSLSLESDVTTQPSDQGTRLAVRYAAVAVVLAALVASGLWIWSTARSNAVVAPEPVELEVFPPSGTTFAAEIGAPWPSISPDGRQLAFVALAANGVSQLWLRPIRSASTQVLPGTDGAARPFWSPDSRSIGFFADGKIKRFDLAPRTVQDVCDAAYLGGMSATWGVGDVILFRHVGGIFRVAASGGPPVPAFPDESNRNQRQNPSFLPDGRRFVFVTYRSRPEDDEICVAALDTKEERCIAKVASPARYAAPGYLLLVRDGALRLQRFDADRLALSGEAIPVTTAPVRVSPVYRPPPFSIAASALAFHPGAAAAQLEWRDRTGATVSVVGELSDYGNSSASADGRYVATTRTDARTDNINIWLNDRGTWSRFTFEDGTDNPLFSPNGSSIAYSARADGPGGLYIKPTSGAGSERRLPRLEGNGMGPQDWSPDGRLILFGISSSNNGWDIGVVAADGESPPRLVIQSQHGERGGKFSRDMKWIAYDSTESGRREVWIQPYPPTGDKWQVTTTGGIDPHWRKNGREELLYVSPDGMLMAVAITLGIAPTIGATTRLFQTLRREGGAGFEMSPDAQRFLLAMPASGADVTPITVRVNWRSAFDLR